MNPAKDHGFYAGVLEEIARADDAEGAGIKQPARSRHIGDNLSDGLDGVLTLEIRRSIPAIALSNERTGRYLFNNGALQADGEIAFPRKERSCRGDRATGLVTHDHQEIGVEVF